jgi:GNAT superfamily N-acetyltransferase
LAAKLRAAVRADVPEILRLIRALADYEKLSHEVVATESALAQTLFGAKPAAEVLLAEQDGRAVGFALFFQNYSTFLGKPGIYLEDLFVEPAQRGQGTGKQLLGALAKIAVERGCGRFEWAVLDWNTPAIGFYEKLGAKPVSDWTIMRVTGEALRKLAS